MMFKDKLVEDYRTLASQHVEMLNHALRNVPGERVRMHICWGNYEGPHQHDAPMEDVLPIALKAKPQIEHPELVAMAEGAKIASARLWS